MRAPAYMDAETPAGTAYNFFKALAIGNFHWARNLTQLWWMRQHGYDHTAALLEGVVQAVFQVEDVVWVKDAQLAGEFNPLIVADVDLLLETVSLGDVVVRCRLVKERQPKVRRERRFRWLPFFKKDVYVPQPSVDGLWGVNVPSIRILSVGGRNV